MYHQLLQMLRRNSHHQQFRRTHLLFAEFEELILKRQSLNMNGLRQVKSNGVYHEIFELLAGPLGELTYNSTLLDS